MHGAKPPPSRRCCGGNVSAIFTSLSRPVWGPHPAPALAHLELEAARPTRTGSLNIRLDPRHPQPRRNGGNLPDATRAGRRQVDPSVPLVDVLRAKAASGGQVQAHIRLSSVPATRVAVVVNDLVHLLMSCWRTPPPSRLDQVKVPVCAADPGGCWSRDRYRYRTSRRGPGGDQRQLASPPPSGVSGLPARSVRSSRLSLYATASHPAPTVRLRAGGNAGRCAVDVAQGGRSGRGASVRAAAAAPGAAARDLLGSAPRRAGSRAPVRAAPGNSGGSGLPTRPVGAGGHGRHQWHQLLRSGRPLFDPTPLNLAVARAVRRLVLIRPSPLPTAGRPSPRRPAPSPADPGAINAAACPPVAPPELPAPTGQRS